MDGVLFLGLTNLIIILSVRSRNERETICIQDIEEGIKQNQIHRNR